MKMIHADLKTDNIMVSGQKLKLCDFGSVVEYNEVELHKTDCLVSPYYRAPEVILGIVPLDGALDVWSAGVTIFELYTGQFMFPATTNNSLLLLMMKTKGKLPAKLSKRGIHSKQHFCEKTGQFIWQAGDKLIAIPEQTESIEKRLSAVASEDVASLSDLIEKCTVLDPQRRMTAEEALMHPFLNQTI